MNWTASHTVLTAVMVASLGVIACSSDESATGSATSSAGATGPGSGASGPGSGASGATGGTGPASGTGASGGTGSYSYDCSAAVGEVPPLRLTAVAEGLSVPLLAKGAPGDTSRLYILERGGVIRLVKDGQLLDTPFLDISAIVQDGGEQGLLGFAFHPQYPRNGRLFVHYTDSGGDTAIAEYRRSANEDQAEPNEVAFLLGIDDPYDNHNGGSIEFGADGYLYIGMGDGGWYGDMLNSGQTLRSLLGKILRVDVDGGSPYSIPPGNVPGAAPEVWDYGLRNPYRMSFDGCTGDLYIGDVGQNAWEEINVEPAGQGNKNYGWRLMEGFDCYNGCDPGDQTTPPVAVYPNPGDAAVIGGYVYRGSQIPGLRGTYFYADFSTGRTWRFAWSGGPVTPVEITDDLQTAGLEPSGFGQDSAGEVYLVSSHGSVYRIEAE